MSKEEEGTWLTPEDRKNYNKYSFVEGAIADSEVESLLAFAKSKLPTANNETSETSQICELYNRPDAWDNEGVISKLQQAFRDQIKKTNFLVGVLEPKRFTLLRTDELQSYSEEYPDFVDGPEVEYTAVVTLNNDYRGGDTDYVVDGEGFMPVPGNLHVHRNERGNNWMIKDVNVKTRYDFMMVMIERPVSARYDEFEIEQTVDDGVDY